MKMLTGQTYFVWNLVTSRIMLEMRSKLIIFGGNVKNTGYLTSNCTGVLLHNFKKNEDNWMKMLIIQPYFVWNLVTSRNMQELRSKLVIFNVNYIPKYGASSFSVIWMRLMVILKLIEIPLHFSQNKIKIFKIFLKISSLSLKYWTKLQVLVEAGHPEFLTDDL